MGIKEKEVVKDHTFCCNNKQLVIKRPTPIRGIITMQVRIQQYIMHNNNEMSN